MRLLVAAVLFVLLVTGCSREVTLDASSDQAIRDSVLAMSYSMPATEFAQLDRAISYFILRGDITAQTMLQHEIYEDELLAQDIITIADLDGMTASQIVQRYRLRSGD